MGKTTVANAVLFATVSVQQPQELCFAPVEAGQERHRSAQTTQQKPGEQSHRLKRRRLRLCRERDMKEESSI